MCFCRLLRNCSYLTMMSCQSIIDKKWNTIFQLPSLTNLLIGVQYYWVLIHEKLELFRVYFWISKLLPSVVNFSTFSQRISTKLTLNKRSCARSAYGFQMLRKRLIFLAKCARAQTSCNNVHSCAKAFKKVGLLLPLTNYNVSPIEKPIL